jgi:hypothetical protein
LTKPAKVFGLDDQRVWKAQKMHGDTYVIADLGENETPEPPDTVAIKLPRELARQIGRYKNEGETLKAAAERLLLEAITMRLAANNLEKIKNDPKRLPVIAPIYLSTVQLQKLHEFGLWNPDQTYRDMVAEVVDSYIIKCGGSV